jgi:hypothetical protein
MVLRANEVSVLAGVATRSFPSHLAELDAASATDRIRQKRDSIGLPAEMEPDLPRAC